MTERSICICVLVLVTLAWGQNPAPGSGYVADSLKAVEIAEKALIPVYGRKQVERERPFKAQLENEIWTVSGTLHCPDGKGGTATHCVGGVAVVQISQRDGHVISMRHYK